jgi:long-chain acyl-CoA synthetase
MDHTPWFDHYDAGVPRSLAPYPERTLLDYLTTLAAKRRDEPAIVFMGAPLGFRALEAQTDAFAAALVAWGLQRGDRIALLLPNSPQFLIAEFAAWKAGAIVAPLNPLYSEPELRDALNRCGANTVVVLTRFYDALKRIQQDTDVERIITTSIKDYLPQATRLLYTVLRERKEGDRIRLHAGDQRLLDLVHRFAGSAPPPHRPAPQDTATLLLSGGTTGLPKAVMGSHHGYVQAGLQLRTWLRSILVSHDDSILLPLPLFHVFANVGAQGLALTGGHPIVMVPNPRDIGMLLKIVKDSRPSVVMLVPALLNAMLNHRSVQTGRVDFSSIKGCFSGAAPLLLETKRQFEELTGGCIVEGYSLTEAFMACIANPLRRSKAGSVGVPLPDVDLRVIDAESGDRTLPQGESGEVILRAPQLLQGYWQNSEETARVLRPFGDGPPWLFTGDIGYLDEEGYLFLVDRKKDLIKVSGLQVWPRDIEEVIARHPAVVDVAVAGVADARRGEVVKAWVVPRRGASLTEGTIRGWCREHLVHYKVPAQVEFRDSLPRNAAGKVLRRELRAESGGGGPPQES